MIRHTLLACFFLLFIGSSAQYGFDEKIEGALIREDLDSLWATLMRTHQDPFFYTEEDDLELAYKLGRQRFLDGGTRQDVLLFIAEMLREMQDSHTYVSFPDLARKIGKEGGRALPFTVSMIDGGLYVNRDQSGQIPLGSQLISINGRPAMEIFGLMNRMSVTEGNSQTGQFRIAEAIMPALVQMAMPIGDDFIVKYSDPTGNDQEVVITGRKIAQVGKRGRIKKDRDPWSFEVDSGIAVIKVTSFSEGKDSKYYRWLNKSFKAIDKGNFKDLVIDLRNNTGGSSERMEALFDHFQLRPVNVPANIIAKQSELSQERFLKEYRGLTRFFLNAFFKKHEDVRNFIHMAEMPIGAVDTVYYNHRRDPSKHRMKGDVYLIINGRTGSASANFAGAFDIHEMGTIVGEPCLGPQGGTWGNPVKYTLPNTDITVSISSIRFNTTNDFLTDPLPVTPDHIVLTSPEDLTAGRDAQIEFIKALIREEGQ